MQSLAPHLISLFRTIVLAAVTAFLITSSALPMSAQNSVPATASQAAKMPEYASRLARPRQSSGTPKPSVARQGPRRVPGRGRHYLRQRSDQRTVDAWTINFGFSVSDSFTSALAAGHWNEIRCLAIPGRHLRCRRSPDREQNGGTTFFDSLSSYSTGSGSNQFGFNVCTESAKLLRTHPEAATIG